MEKKMDITTDQRGPTVQTMTKARIGCMVGTPSSTSSKLKTMAYGISQQKAADWTAACEMQAKVMKGRIHQAACLRSIIKMLCCMLGGRAAPRSST